VTSIRQWVEAAALIVSVVTAVSASLAVVRVRNVITRLHYPGIVGSVSGPLLALAVLLDAGPGMTTLTVAVTAALLAFTGPVLTAAIGKLNAPRAVRSTDRHGEGE
jgi:multisubunit Na+/H+ antiporter MnhG subunit